MESARSLMMQEVRTYVVSLYVDRASQQWVVRDPEGNFWVLTTTENAWDGRQPFYARRGDGAGTRSRALQVHARHPFSNEIE